MAHSYHTTRRHLDEAEQHRYADERHGRDAVERLKEELATKRRAKWQARLLRRRKTCPTPVAVEAMPIEVDASSPCIDYGVTVDDLRALLAALPAGAADGLSVIRLEPGIESQRRWCEEDDEELVTDPYVGRLGYERLPGVYSGRSLGGYCPRTAQIILHGFACDSGRAGLEPWRFYLKLCVLTTFVHELAHHYDFTMRVARGRWRMDDPDKAEKYAEGIQYDWTSSHVIPYLVAACPDELALLEGWMREHLGVVLPLRMLAGDPRTTAKKDWIAFLATFFCTTAAFERSVREFASGRRDAVAIRLDLACDLHYAEEYEWADRIIDVVLADDPRHVEALTLKADILVHREQPGEAIGLAAKATALAPDYPDPLKVMADAHEGLGNWKQVARLTERLMSLYDERAWEYYFALAQHARATLELGDLDTARSDITSMSNGPGHFKRQAKRLKRLLERRESPRKGKRRG